MAPRPTRQRRFTAPLRALTPLARRPLALGPHDSTLPRTPFARSLSCLTATRPRLSSLSSPRLSLTRRAAISGEIPSWTRTPRPGLPPFKRTLDLPASHLPSATPP